MINDDMKNIIRRIADKHLGSENIYLDDKNVDSLRAMEEAFKSGMELILKSMVREAKRVVDYINHEDSL